MEVKNGATQSAVPTKDNKFFRLPSYYTFFYKYLFHCIYVYTYTKNMLDTVRRDGFIIMDDDRGVKNQHSHTRKKYNKI